MDLGPVGYHSTLLPHHSAQGWVEGGYVLWEVYPTIFNPSPNIVVLCSVNYHSVGNYYTGQNLCLLLAHIHLSRQVLDDRVYPTYSMVVYVVCCSRLNLCQHIV